MWIDVMSIDVKEGKKFLLQIHFRNYEMKWIDVETFYLMSEMRIEREKFD